MDQATGRAAADEARLVLARAQAGLAEAALSYADTRRASDLADPRFGVDGSGRVRARAGEFAADELAAVWRHDPWAVRGLLARSRRVRSGLPAIWEAHRRGLVDTDQVRVIDRAARRASAPATVAAIDARAVDAAQTRTAKQLDAWLLRLVVEHEPLSFAARHHRALAERRVTVSQGPDGMGYVTGELSADDVAHIDQLLTALARGLGPVDPRTEQQRRADLMADLLLGRLRLTDPDDTETDDTETDDTETDDTGTDDVDWVEVEDVDLDTGELLGTRLLAIDADGRPVETSGGGPSMLGAGRAPFGLRPRPVPRALRIGVVVPLSSLLGLSDTPGQLADRSAAVPADVLRDTIASALTARDDHSEPVGQVLFTRLLTDDGGRLLDTRELGRTPSRRLAEAVMLRAGSCRFPTCTVPAVRCDLDHHQPVPYGPTAGHNLDPSCRRHHRGKTFAWLATVRDRDAVDWTLPDAHVYRCLDDPLPTR